MISALQAAELTGKKKQTILKAIKAGRLSAQKDGKGQWSIDPAELFRVYPGDTSNGIQQHTHTDTGIHPELETLRNENKMLRERLHQRDEDVSDYRRRLDRSEQRITALLPAPRVPEPTQEPEPTPPRKSVWDIKSHWQAFTGRETA